MTSELSDTRVLNQKLTRKDALLGILITVVLVAIFIFLIAWSTSTMDEGEGIRMLEENCKRIGMQDDLILLYSSGCLHCQQAIDKLADIAVEHNISILAVHTKGSPFIENVTQFQVPIFFKDCKPYLGDRSIDDYMLIIFGDIG